MTEWHRHGARLDLLCKRVEEVVEQNVLRTNTSIRRGNLAATSSEVSGDG